MDELIGINEIISNKRSVYTSLDNNKVDLKKHYFGLFIYIVFFVIIIPYILVKNKLWIILSAYFPNLDLLAACIGFNGGPYNYNIWKYLYNPNNITKTGYHSTTLINYISLMGISFVIANHTLKTKHVYGGLSIAAFIFPITYLMPNNIVVNLMNKFSKFIHKFRLNDTLNYILPVLYGIIIILLFIIAEGLSIYYFSESLAQFFKKIYKI